MSRISGVVAAAIAGLMTVAGLPAAAQDYPNRPITMVMPFATGGPADVIGRLVSTRMSAVLGQSVVVDNRTGAGGTIGAGIVAKARPDGYTLLYATSSTHGIAPALQKNMPYDPIASFVPISQVAATTSLVLVQTSLPVQSIKDLAAYSKANPGKLNFGSAGPGTPSHLGTSFLNILAGIDGTHVPYRSGGQALTALLGGEIQYLQDSVLTSAEHVTAGKLRPIAIAGDQRSPTFPAVATLKEQGIAEHLMGSWNGIMGPAGTPQEVVDKVYAAVKVVLDAPEIKDTFARYDTRSIGSSPTEFAATLVSEINRWKAAVERIGIKPE